MRESKPVQVTSGNQCYLRTLPCTERKMYEIADLNDKNKRATVLTKIIPGNHAKEEKLNEDKGMLWRLEVLSGCCRLCQNPIHKTFTDNEKKVKKRENERVRAIFVSRVFFFARDLVSGIIIRAL